MIIIWKYVYILNDLEDQNEVETERQGERESEMREERGGRYEEDVPPLLLLS